jgi:hypothetical protein
VLRRHRQGFKLLTLARRSSAVAIAASFALHARATTICCAAILEL